MRGGKGYDFRRTGSRRVENNRNVYHAKKMTKAKF